MENKWDEKKFNALAKKIIDEIDPELRNSLERADTPLTVEMIHKGMNLIMGNATGLYEDALILFQNKRYARTISLTILCEEELGKLVILDNMILISHDNRDRWNDLWNPNLQGY